jgi:hypothetical protein
MNGPHFVVRALNNGLLAAFILSWPWIQRIQIDRDCGASLLSAGFFGILEDYLVYRSVLRSVDKALKVVEGMDILVHACEAWVAFQQVASARLHLKEEFDAQSDSRLDRGFFGCAYHDVRKYID